MGCNKIAYQLTKPKSILHTFKPLSIMKIINEYQCEICGKRYNSADAADKCESRGVANANTYPIGLMYEYHHGDFIGIFSIAEATPSTNSKHTVDLSSWACRTTGYPESLGEQKCGGVNNYLSTDEDSLKKWASHYKITKDKVNCPEYIRMVEFLKSQNITPTYYNELGDLITVN